MGRAQLGNRNSVGPRLSIRGELNHGWGKHRSKEVTDKLRASAKARWLDCEFVRKQMKARKTRPNQKELWLEEFILQLGLPYKYVGDGEFILGGKCPDYVNTNGQKKIIELFGNYWHRNENPQERKDIFSQYGFETLVIWESQLTHTNSLKELILSFHNSEHEKEELCQELTISED